MKRVMALLLAAMLVIGDTVPAFAQTLPETAEQFAVSQESSVSVEEAEEIEKETEEIEETEIETEEMVYLYEEESEAVSEEEVPIEVQPALAGCYAGPESNIDPMGTGYAIRIVSGSAMGYLKLNGEQTGDIETVSPDGFIDPHGNSIHISDLGTVTAHAYDDGDYVFVGWEIPDRFYDISGGMSESNVITAQFEEGIRVDFEVSENAEEVFTVEFDPDGLLENGVLPVGTEVTAKGPFLQFSNPVYDGTLARIEGKSYEYGFKEWSGIPEDGILTENTTITAVFESTDNPVVSVSATEGGAVSPAEDFKVPMYTKVWADGNQLTYQGQGKDSGFSGTVTAEAEAGYQFSGWYLNDGSFRTKLRSDGNYENGFYVVNCDTAFVAKFSKLPDTYRIHAYCKDGGGIVTPTYVMANYGDTFREDGNKLYVGDEVFEATAYYGYKFKRWSGVPQNVTKEDTVWAEFDYIFKSLEISAGEGGRIRTSMNGTVKEGKKLSGQVWLGISLSYGEGWLKIGSNYYYPSPDAGYLFDHWTFAPALDEKGRITGDTVIGAVFRVSRPTVTLSCWNGGSTDPAGSIEVAYNTPIRADGKKLYIGDDTVVTAVPEENYVFAGWLNIPESGLITDELTVTAKFVKDGFRVVIGGNNNTELFVNSVRQTYSSYELKEVRWGTKVETEGNVLRIGDQEFRVEAGIGFEFSGWKGIPADGIVTGELYITPKISEKKWDLNAEAGEGGKLKTSSGHTYSKYAGKMANGGKLSVLGRLLLYDVYNSKTGRVYEDSLEAVANTGYRFVRWEGLPDTGKADRDVNAKAVFEPIISTVTIKRWAGAGGTVDRLKVDNVPYGASLRCSGNVLYVGDQMVTAKPFDGYKVYWNITSDYVYEDCEVIVEFDPITYSATFSHTEGGSTSRDIISGIGHGKYVYTNGNRVVFGTEVVTAIADEGYAFKEWTGLPESRKVTDNLFVKAVFEIIKNDVSVTVQAGGSVDVSTVNGVEYGTAVKADGNKLTIGNTIITATAENEKFEFTGWEGIPNNGKVTEALSITAGFRQARCLVHFVIGENGSVEGDSTKDMLVPVGTRLYYYNGALRMYYNGTPKISSKAWTAVPEEGYRASWEGYPEDGTVTEDLTVTATFEKQRYSVLVETDYDSSKYRKKGKVNGDASVKLNAEYGTPVTVENEMLKIGDTVITASPNEGYVFDRWEGIPENGIVEGPLTIKAVFNIQQYAFYFKAGEGGKLSPKGRVVVTYGDKITADGNKLYFGEVCVTAEADEGYRFTGWSNLPENMVVDGKNLSSITANFEKADARITKQPADKTVYSSGNAKFTVEADGYGTLSYQWEYKSASSSKWSKMTGTAAKKASIEVSAASYSGYSFRCTVTDGRGTKAVSDAAKLTAVSAAKISTNPSAATVYEGDSVSFSAKASGHNLAYQWQELTGDSWNDISGANALTYSFQAAYAQSGRSHRLKATDGLGTVLYSKTAVLTVYRKPEITAQPENVKVENGSKVIFSVETRGGSGTLTYQWQRKTSSSGSWTAISGSAAQKASYQLTVSTSNSGYQYRCIVKDSKGTKVTSSAAKLTVVDKLSISSQPTSAIAESGKTVSFTVGAKGAETYQWQFSTDGAVWENCSQSTAGTKTLQVTAGDSTFGTSYRCVLGNSLGRQLISNAVKLSKKETLKIVSQPASTTVKKNEYTTFAVGATGDGLTYKWQYYDSEDGWTSAGSTTAELQVKGKTVYNKRRYRCYVKDKYGNYKYTDTVYLYVK